jgi:hypothetical protein
MEAEIQKKIYSILQVKCPSLLTDRNQTYKICRECVENARCDVSEKYLEGSRDTDERVLCSPSKVRFIIDRSKPNLQGL